MDWLQGYVDVEYTHDFYREMTPSLHNFALLSRGIEARIDLQNFTYCELGCGQGFGTTLLAAAHPGSRFYANDFIPGHIAYARKLAHEAGATNVNFYDDGFADFGQRDLPEFDYIVLHGVYSWVSQQSRREIIDFIARKLKIGGIVYISYNCQPGWAGAAPLRDLMIQFAGDPAKPLLPRVETALNKVEALLNSNPLFLRLNPGLKTRFDGIKQQSRSYIAHEYFNTNWTIFYHTDVARELADAKLEFATTAQLLDHVDNISLTQEQQALLAGTQHPGQREVLRDFITNQQFRRDLFIKGGLRIGAQQRTERLMDLRFALGVPPADISLKLLTVLGTNDMNAALFEPVIEAFTAGPHSIRELQQDGPAKGMDFGPLLEAITILTGRGQLHPCLDSAGLEQRAAGTRAFNRAVMERARHGSELLFLASPLTGSGVAADRFTQLFLLARELGQDGPQLIWDCMSARGERLMRDGQPMTPEENLARLREIHAIFKQRLPLLKQLGIA